MPQTKSKLSTRRSSSSARGSRSSSPKSNGASGARTKAKAKARKVAKARKAAPTSNGVASKAAAASNGVASSVKRSAKGVPPLVRKAKVPLVASGAALAGVAGAVAATHAGKRPKVLGVSMPKANGMKPDAKKVSDAVVDIAKRADRFGKGVSRVANSVQGVGETAKQVSKKA